MRYLACVGVVAFCAAAGPGRAQAGAADTSFAAFERAVRAELAAAKVPGAAVALVRGDSVVYAGGIGAASVETGAPVTADMLFQVGSASKVLTALLLAVLAEQGALRLDAPARTYVSGLPPRLGALTLHQLLSHSSGLRDVPGAGGLHDEGALAAYPRTWTAEWAPLLPGLFSYSNAGYALAGLAAQEAAGKPFADLARERVLAPLGMERTTYRPLEALTRPAAVGHAAPPGQEPRRIPSYADDTRLWPAGYAWSSARDMARLLAALMADGRVGGRQALPAAAVARVRGRHVEVPNLFTDAAYGYGLFTGTWRGVPSVWHDGQMDGFGALVRILPARGLGVVVLLNREGVRPDRIADLGFAALGVAWPEAPAPAAKPEVTMSAAEMASYAGRYENRFPLELFVREGALFRRWFGQEQRVWRVGPRRFTVDPARTSPAAEFTIAPAEAARPAYVQAFLWVFVKTGGAATPPASPPAPAGTRG
jgi:CubicO group peptidase (beta-lactamase class C family)